MAAISIENVNKATHMYKQFYTWKNLKEFNDFVLKSVVYNNDGIVAINKPYGVKIYQSYGNETNNEPEEIKTTSKTSSQPDFKYAIDQSLSFLKTELNEKDLCIVKATERYTSGITLLAASSKIKLKIQNAILTSKSKRKSPFNFLSVNTGQLQQPLMNERVGIVLKTLDGGKFKQPDILSNFSNQQVKKGAVKPAFVDVQVIASDPIINTSLLRISSTQLKWHFLRLYCAHKGVPILGDCMYASRVRWLYGKPFLLSIHNQAAYQPTLLPNDLHQRLKWHESDASGIPTHLHLEEIRLPIKGKEEISIRAEVPSFFNWTCQQLNLSQTKIDSSE